MPQEWPRPIAICFFRKNDRIFVAEGYDSKKDETFYRPLGGTIEFGEYGCQTVAREIKEEIGEDVTNVRYMGLSEKIFTYLGETGHEIVLIYDGDFVDSGFYQKSRTLAREGDYEFTALWKPITDFADGKTPLYPDGLLDILLKD